MRDRKKEEGRGHVVRMWNGGGRDKDTTRSKQNEEVQTQMYSEVQESLKRQGKGMGKLDL